MKHKDTNNVLLCVSLHLHSSTGKPSLYSTLRSRPLKSRRSSGTSRFATESSPYAPLLASPVLGEAYW